MDANAADTKSVWDAIVALIVFVVGGVMGGVVAFAKGQQQLKDHIITCDQRYEDLRGRFERVEKGVDEIRGVLLRAPGH